MNPVVPRAGVARKPEPPLNTTRPNETARDRRANPACASQSHPGTHRKLTDEAPLRQVRQHAFASNPGHAGSSWGRAGELFAAAKLGLKLCRNYTQGHDGRMGNDLVEIKTITPGKRRVLIRVKRSGNFSLLAVVRFLSDIQAELRVIPRSRLPKGNGGAYLVLSWTRACALAEPVPRGVVDAAEAGECGET